MAAPYRYVIGPVVERAEGGLTCYSPPDSCVSWIDLRRMGEQSALGQLGCGFFTMPSGWAIPSGYHWLAQAQGEGDCRSLYLTEQDQSAWASLIGVTPTRTASTMLVDALDETLTDLADPTGENAPKPLVPGALSGPPAEADIILGGHSRVRRRQVPAAGRWWNNLVSLAKRDVQAIIDRDPHDKLWRKYVGSLAHKYHGKWDDERGNEFIPDKAKKDRTPTQGGRTARRWAMRPETMYTESFDGANSDVFGVDLTWTEVAGDWDVVSNQGAALSNGYRFARAEHDVSSSDNTAAQSVTACTDGANNHQVGPICRMSSSAVTGYGLRTMRYFSPDKSQLVKWVSGVLTALGSDYDGNYTPSFAQRVDADGSALYMLLDDVSRASATDTAISSGTRGGVFVYHDSTPAVRIDNWSIADLASAPVAALSGAPLSGTSPLNVVFTDASTNTPTSWLWERSSDGGSNWSTFATSQNPTQSFAAGTWSIRLTATNAGGSDAEEKVAYIVASDSRNNGRNRLLMRVG